MIETVIAQSSSRPSPLLQSYIARVMADGGTIDIPEQDIRARFGLVKDAYWAIIVSARKEGKLYAIVPNDGSGDVSVERNSKATEITSQNTVIEIENNLPIFEWSSSKFLGCNISRQVTNIVPDSAIAYYGNNLSKLENVILENDYEWDFSEIYTHALYFPDNTVRRTASKVVLVNNPNFVVVSFFIEMEDGSQPKAGLDNDENADFSIYIGGANALVGNGYIVYKKISETVWYVSGCRDYAGTSTNQHVRKNTNQSSKAFRIVGFQIETGVKYPGTHVVTYGSPATKLFDSFTSQQVRPMNTCCILMDMMALNTGSSASNYFLQLYEQINGENGIFVGINVIGQLTVKLINGATIIEKSGWRMLYDQYFHLAVQLNENALMVYINGELEIADYEFQNPFDNSSRIGIGSPTGNIYVKAISIMPVMQEIELIEITKL